jgi:hypothetical protein
MSPSIDKESVYMAEHGEWNKKGATLSHVTAKKEYGVTEDFIIQGIRAGRLEYREGVIWGNPYLRVLRSQLEKYIGEELGREYLEKVTGRLELRMIDKEIPELKNQISELQRRLRELKDRKTYLEKLLKK